MNEASEKYLKNFRLAFPVFNDDEKRFYNELKSSILAYVDKNPACTMDDLIEIFGDPKEIVIDYFDGMDSSVYFVLMRRAKYIQAAINAFMVFVIAIIVIWAAYYYGALQNSIKEVTTNENKMIEYNYNTDF